MANKNFYAVVIRSADHLNGTLVGLYTDRVATWTKDKQRAVNTRAEMQAEFGGGFYNYELVETTEPRDWKA